MKNNIHHILIVANGETPARDLISFLTGQADLVIAADGGARICSEHGIEPDLIVGDLDSCPKAILESADPSKVIRLSEQETTDLQKALETAGEYSPDRIDIVSAHGIRTDHAVGNLIAVIDYFRVHDFTLYLHDEFGTLSFLRPGVHKLILEPGTHISLFSLGPVKNLDLSGFKYSLNKADYETSFSGISNEVTGKTQVIAFTEGIISLYRIKQLDAPDG